MSKIYLFGLLLVAFGVTSVSFAGWTESHSADEPKSMNCKACHDSFKP